MLAGSFLSSGGHICEMGEDFSLYGQIIKAEDELVALRDAAMSRYRDPQMLFPAAATDWPVCLFQSEERSEIAGELN